MNHDTHNNDLQMAVQQFVTERNWDRYHTPKNLAMSIAIEAAELMEHFQWVTNEQSVEIIQVDETRVQVADELADILIYCLSFLNKLDVEMNTAILHKLRSNENRYPIGYTPIES